MVKRLSVLILVLVVCAACGSGETVSPSPSIATATVVPSATPLPEPTPLPDPTSVPTPVPGTLYVDANQGLGAISPFVYGTNYGPWSVVPFDLQPQAEAAGIAYLRFPGGNWGDQHNLRPFHIDPLQQPKPTMAFSASQVDDGVNAR